MSKSGSAALKPEPSGQPFPVMCADGVALEATLFPASSDERAMVLIGNALGVPQTFYAGLASFLSSHGFSVVTFDYRGIKDSGRDAPRGRDILMEHWGSLDTDAVLAAMKRHRPAGRLLLLGHSAGGQLFGLAENSRDIDGLVLVSSLLPHWRSLKTPHNLLVFLLTRIIIPVFGFGRDTFPARMLRISSVNMPRGAMQQWARWSRLRHYLWDPRSGVDTSRYGSYRFPLLVCHIDDDNFAPWAAIEEQLAQLPAARLEVWQVESALAPGGRLGHISFFRESMGGVFWPRLAERMHRLTESEP